MGRKHKIASLAVAGLAVLFDAFFIFLRHSPVLSPVIPFVYDPYDAIGSMAMVVGTLLALLCLRRTFLPESGQLRSTPGPSHPTDPLRLVFLARAEVAVAMSVLVVLEADMIAMTRHLSAWRGTPAIEIPALIGGMAAASFAVLALAGATVCHLTVPGTRRQAIRAAAVLVVCIVALAFYPEHFLRSTPLYFLTIVAGDVIFFASVSALTSAALPLEISESHPQVSASRFFSSTWMQWGAITMLGIAMGACALLGEIFAHGRDTGLENIPPAPMVIVFAMFLGSGATGLLIAFAFLRKPLGLFRKASH